MTKWRVGAAMAVMVASGTALAEDPPAAAEAPVVEPAGTRWTVQLEPMLWNPALVGEIAVSGGELIDVDEYDLDEAELTPAGEVTIRSGAKDGDWWFVFSGFSFDTEGGKTANGLVNIGGPLVEAGDRLDFDLRFTSVEGWVEYALPAIIDEGEVRWRFNLCLGARLYDVSLDTEINGSSGTSDDNTWVEPVAGVHMVLDLPHGFGMDLAANGGGFVNGDDSSLSWNITLGFTWQFCPNAAVEIGYRILSVDLESGDDDPFVFDNALAGLWGSFVVRF